MNHQRNHALSSSLFAPKPVLLAIILSGLAMPIMFQAQTASTEKQVTAVYRLGGQPMGTYLEKRSQDSDGNLVTQIDSDMIFNRVGTKLELKSTSRYLETPAGELISINSVSSSSQQPTTIHAVVRKDSLIVTTTTGGHSYDRTIAVTGRLIGPEAARQLAVSQLHALGEKVSYQTFSPELGNIITVTDKALALSDTPGNDTSEPQQASGLKIEQTMSGIPSTLTLWMDGTGWILRQVMSSPLGDIEAVRSDAASVESAAIAGATLPEESFNRSIVTSNIRLPEERLIENIKLKIIAKHPEGGWPDFTADNQTVLEKTPEYVILEVRRPVPQAEGVRSVVATGALRNYLEANALLQSDDSGVRQIEASVVHKGDSSWTAARALQRWTADNMHFDLGIAVVPASEVAKDHGGTCFGYSVLLGSLARAAGIPSRIRVGLVYAGGIWGGHAWVEVLIGDQWIPIDGALYAPGPADAARFSVFTSSLDEGTVGNLGGLGQVLGNVDIKILEYTVNGKHVVVKDDSRPYTIAGDMYRNPWIGLSVAKPSGFHFTGYDLAWPQTTVIAMDGPLAQRVEVHNESASLPASPADRDKLFREKGFNGPIQRKRLTGRDVAFVENQDSAAMIFEDRGTVWLVKATGTHAVSLLKQVVSSMRTDP